MDRREFLKVTGGTGLALSTGFRFPERRTRTAMQPAVTAPALAATSAPCQFGAFVNPFGADPITAIGAFETLIGRPLAITRHDDKRIAARCEPSGQFQPDACRGSSNQRGTAGTHRAAARPARGARCSPQPSPLAMAITLIAPKRK